MENINQKKRKRFEFLNLLYEKSEPLHLPIDTDDIGKELNLNEVEAHSIAQYLHNEGLLILNNMTSRITHNGIIEIEKALSEPEKPTEHFLPVNIINVQNMNNSQIVQGSTHTTQTQNVTQNQGERLSEFIKLFERQLSDIQFRSNEDKQEAIAEVSTLKAQLDSPKPKWEIIKSAGNTVKGILEKAAAMELVEYLKDLF